EGTRAAGAPTEHLEVGEMKVHRVVQVCCDLPDLSAAQGDPRLCHIGTERFTVGHPAVLVADALGALLLELEASDTCDLAVVLVGVDDVLAGRRPDQWQEDLAAVLDCVARRPD